MSDWRLFVAYSRPAPAAVLKRLAEAAGDHSPKSIGAESTWVYASDERAAGAAFTQAEQYVELKLVSLERWDQDRSDWIAEGHIGSNEPGITRRKHPDPKRRRFIVWLVVANVVGMPLLYFTPGAQFSPNPGDLHDLGWTLGMAALINAGAICCYLFQLRSRETDRP
jgi:hypothetical protein